MQYVEYGAHNSQIIILLHGGGLSWWNYRDAAQLLSDCFHVILPILDGHADSDAPFTSIEDNASRVIAHIDEHFGGKVLAVGGLSLGGQIAVEMLTQRPAICSFALLESTLVKPSKLTHALIKPVFGMSYGLIKQKWFAKLQAAYRTILVDRDILQMLLTMKAERKIESDYVFCSPTGGILEPGSQRKRLQRLLESCGMEKIRFHDLRHTFATLALQNGVDVKTLSGLLGHYSAGFTLDTYGHISTQMQRMRRRR